MPGYKRSNEKETIILCGNVSEESPSSTYVGKYKKPWALKTLNKRTAGVL